MNLKRILLAIAAVAMIVAGSALLYAMVRHDPGARPSSNSESGQSMFLGRVDVGLRVGEDGSLQVREVLSYDLGDTTWHGLFQDVILAGGEKVRSVRVTRLDSGTRQRLEPGSGIKLGVGGAYGTYGYGVIKDPDRRLRIVWNVNDTGRHDFEIRYRLSGAVKNYSDASTLLWDVWGTGWETGVGVLTATVRFPGRIKLFHPRAGDLQRRVSDTRVRGRVGSFVVTDIPERRQIQVRAAAAPLTGVPAKPQRIMTKLRAEQAAIDARNAKQAAEGAKLRAKPFSWFLIRSLIGAIIGLLLVAAAWALLGRDATKMVHAGGSYQYPPEEIPPPVIAKALGGAETENLVSATLLGFLQRDVFRVLPSVEKKEDVSIRNLVGDSTFKGADVEAYEQPIAELLQSAIDAHPEHSPDFTKLKKNLSPKDAQAKIASFEASLKAEYPKYGLEQTYRGRLRRWLIGIAALAVYGLSLMAAIGTTGGNIAVRYEELDVFFFLVGLAPVLLAAAIEGNAFYRLKSDQAERVRKWETYQDFFAQMDMSREYPLTVEIWDQALLYAAAFGYAEKVITNMPRTDAQGTRLTSSDTVGVGWLSGNAWALGSFSHMSSGISGVTGMASSSSSGGGGFSGGGSGGGGGGGW